MKICENYVKKM